MRVEDFEGRKPAMSLEGFFAGRTQAWGIFQDRFGALRQQFHVDVRGTWDAHARTLHLHENFTYTDGRTERRIWTIEKLDGNRYRAHAEDVVGEATAKACGNVVNLTYRMKLKIGGVHWMLKFDDWMFRQDDRVVINRASVSKWGFEIGTATIMFRKNSDRDQAPGAGPDDAPCALAG